MTVWFNSIRWLAFLRNQVFRRSDEIEEHAVIVFPSSERRLSRPSNFLYMILYIGGGHTEGLAVLAFVCLQ